MSGMFSPQEMPGSSTWPASPSILMTSSTAKRKRSGMGALSCYARFFGLMSTDPQ